MKLVLSSLALAAAVSSVASATFVEYYTVKTQSTNSGVDLDVYNLYARFNGATDTLLNAFNWNAIDGAACNSFYHKDLSDSNSSTLMTAFGTWAPQLTGNATTNRPFDSFLSIGATNGATSGTAGDPSWSTASAAGWTVPGLPTGYNVGWFNSSPPNLQGRVGVAGNTADSVRLGQFVLARDFTAGNFNLKIGYNSGIAGAAVQFYEGSFFLGVPTPGAIALLGLAGLTGRRRR
jgi:hypothetical protein